MEPTTGEHAGGAAHGGFGTGKEASVGVPCDPRHLTDVEFAHTMPSTMIHAYLPSTQTCMSADATIFVAVTQSSA
jgi:hypothetical protein